MANATGQKITKTGHGAFDTEREAANAVRYITGSPAESWGPGMHKHLEDACRAAGVTLGSYDHAILLWLSGWEPSTVAVIAGLITRAQRPGGVENGHSLGPVERIRGRRA